MVVASVELPPLPKVNSRPPASKRAAIGDGGAVELVVVALEGEDPEGPALLALGLARTRRGP